MIAVVAFAANALLNFALGLLIAWFLGPEAFGSFAIGATLMIILNAIFLEWIKLSTLRFYTHDAKDRTDTRRSLDGLFTYSALAMGVVVLIAWVFGFNAQLPNALMAATVAAAIGGGLFDYMQGITRAKRDDAAYARLVLLKNILAFLLMVGGAYFFHSPVLVMLGLAVSSSLAVVAFWRRMSDGPLGWSVPERHQLNLFAKYAFPLIAANIFYASVPFLNRVLMAERFGLSEAGVFALASDIGFKVLVTTSAALEILMLPAVVAITESSGIVEARKAIARNMVIGLAVLLPLAAGLIIVMPAFEQLLVPPAFRGRFATYLIWLMPAFLALSLAQACFTPVFMIAKETRFAIVAGAIAVAINAAALFILKDSTTPQSIILAMAVGMGTGLLILAVTAVRRLSSPLAWGEIASVLFATMVMIGVLWPFRLTGPAWLNLPLMAICGMLLYSSVILLFNVAGSRYWLRQRLSSRST
jgi:O-antigen/teichoic acid export membrane protein